MRARIAVWILAAASLGAMAQEPLAPIGEARVVQGLQTAAGVDASLRWAELPRGGHVAALRISSRGAQALRVAIRVGKLPRDAMLRFYAPGDQQVHEASAASLLEALARNRDAGESGPDARTWWSPLVAGDTLVLEVELAPGSDPAALAIAVPLVSHIGEWPRTPRSDDEARALGVVTSGGMSYACAGDLVASASAIAIESAPARYFLAASRCIATQSAASSLQVFWPQGASGVGARLLYASPDTDNAFLALDAPPAQAMPVAHPSLATLDPALEQWLGAGAATRAAAIGAFSSP